MTRIVATNSARLNAIHRGEVPPADIEVVHGYASDDSATLISFEEDRRLSKWSFVKNKRPFIVSHKHLRASSATFAGALKIAHKLAERLTTTD